jgi:hypothetical protein
VAAELALAGLQKTHPEKYNLEQETKGKKKKGLRLDQLQKTQPPGGGGVAPGVRDG